MSPSLFTYQQSIHLCLCRDDEVCVSVVQRYGMRVLFITFCRYIVNGYILVVCGVLRLKAESWHVKTGVRDYVDEASQTFKETSTMSTNTHVCLLPHFHLSLKMGQITHDTRITACTYFLLVCTLTLIIFKPTYCKLIGIIFTEHVKHPLHVCFFKEIQFHNKLHNILIRSLLLYIRFFHRNSQKRIFIVSTSKLHNDNLLVS